jgi:hypothetical protein
MDEREQSTGPIGGDLYREVAGKLREVVPASLGGGKFCLSVRSAVPLRESGWRRWFSCDVNLGKSAL